MINKSALIKAKIKDVLPESEIMLCGSRARNDASIDGDYDILIKTKEQIATREKFFSEQKSEKNY
ncbi:MAG: nucleotidyltransferase domain-containing protein [Bacteroidota bacterium]